MDTLQAYIDSLFSNIESSPEMLRIKAEMTQNMTEKYSDLIANGASEHEALGRVIAEFGDIDELVDEMNFAKKETSQPKKTFVPFLSKPEINQYIAKKTQLGLLNGLATFIIIASVALFISLQAIFGEDRPGIDAIGITIILVATVISVAVFLISHQRSKDLDWIEKGHYTLKSHQRREIENLAQDFKRTHTIATIIGIALIILPVIPIIIVGSMDLSEQVQLMPVSGLIFCTGAATFLFIYTGNIRSIYQQLLSTPDFNTVNQDPEKHRRQVEANHTFENIYWPLVLIVYFIWSFRSGAWHITWLIFLAANIFEHLIRHLFNLPDQSED